MRDRASIVLNYILILFAFLLPISTPLSNVSMGLLILVWIIEGRWKEKFIVLKQSKAFLSYLVFILFIGCSLFWSDSIYGGFSNHAKNAVTFFFSYYVFDFMLIPILITSVKINYARYILSAFLVAMLVSELMSWGIFAEVVHYKHVSSHDPSPFMHHTFYSIFLAVTIFVLLRQFLYTKSIAYKVLIGLFMLSAIVNLFLNGGRLGQLAFFVAMVLFIVLRYKITLKSFLLSFSLLLGIFILAYTISPIFKNRMNLSLQSLQKISEGNYNSSWGIRTNILIVAKEIVKENLILGVGIGDAKQIFLKKSEQVSQTEFFPKLRHLHNGYMQILVETGIIGLLLFGIFIINVLNLNLHKDQFALMVVIVTIYLVGFMGEPLLFSRKSYLLFNFFISLFIYQSLQKKKYSELLF